jgi:hypothetical protein
MGESDEGPPRKGNARGDVERIQGIALAIHLATSWQGRFVQFAELAQW